MIPADISALVEYDRAPGSAVDRRLTALIETGGPLAVTEPVMMTVLAGARSDQREYDLRRLLLRCELLHFDAVADFDAAVLLTCDADLEAVARVVGIDLDEAPGHSGHR
ncbi:MAG: VapC toxin family PIN domain ribonuclease [Actinomycetota bacterium]|nr:VapC toxin family PIN domain ribonuclease [Actinomycetota bacterium]